MSYGGIIGEKGFTHTHTSRSHFLQKFHFTFPPNQANTLHTMTFNLLTTIKSTPLSPLMILCGPEVSVRQECRRRLVTRALEGAVKEMNYTAYESETVDLSTLLSACLDFPCFAERRVVLLKGSLKLNKKQSPQLIQYIQNPQETTTFIFETNSLDGRLDWVKKLKKSPHTTLLEFPMARPQECFQWMGSIFKREGKQASREVLEKIYQYLGADLGALSGAVRQVSLFVGDSPKVELNDVDQLLVKITDENVFAVMDHLFEGKQSEFLKALNALLKTGEAPLKILSLVYRHLAILLSLQSSPELAQTQFKLSPWILKKYHTQLKRLGSRLDISLLAPLVLADRQLKSSTHPPQLILLYCVEEMMERIHA